MHDFWVLPLYYKSGCIRCVFLNYILLAFTLSLNQMQIQSYAYVYLCNLFYDTFHCLTGQGCWEMGTDEYHFYYTRYKFLTNVWLRVHQGVWVIWKVIYFYLFIYLLKLCSTCVHTYIHIQYWHTLWACTITSFTLPAVLTNSVQIWVYFEEFFLVQSLAYGCLPLLTSGLDALKRNSLLFWNCYKNIFVSTVVDVIKYTRKVDIFCFIELAKISC